MSQMLSADDIDALLTSVTGPRQDTWPAWIPVRVSRSLRASLTPSAVLLEETDPELARRLNDE